MYQITVRERTKFERWRAKALYWHLSDGAKARLEWIIFYQSVAEGNATEVARYFGISRKTFWKWQVRFNPLNLTSLEEKSRRPTKTRVWTVTSEEEQRVVDLRNESKCKWGKEKLRVEYKRVYGEFISTGKIQKIINKNSLFPDLSDRKKILKKKKQDKLRPKLRIHQFKTTNPNEIVWHIDTICFNWYGAKRYIVTALEDKTKIAFARCYQNHSSIQSTDFLKRLIYLTGDQIKVIHTDNGSEFEAHFRKACNNLLIQQIYSRVRTPKDNPALERFNRTLQEEWLSVSEVGLDNILEANLDLTSWLIKYNFQRPHQTLDYKTPIEYAQTNYPEVLPMYPARTPALHRLV